MRQDRCPHCDNAVAIQPEPVAGSRVFAGVLGSRSLMNGDPGARLHRYLQSVRPPAAGRNVAPARTVALRAR